MFAVSHSTTFPTAPVEACVIFSSTTYAPETPVILIAIVPLKVVAAAAEPAAFGSLIKLIFLKSFATVTSPELPLYVPSSEVFNITKNPPNSSTAFLPWPPFGGIITSNTAPDKFVAPAVTICALLTVAKV